MSTNNPTGTSTSTPTSTSTRVNPRFVFAAAFCFRGGVLFQRDSPQRLAPPSPPDRRAGADWPASWPEQKNETHGGWRVGA